MKLRSRHLVCLLLLASALRLAEGAELSTGQYGMGGRYIGALLTRLAPLEAADRNVAATAHLAAPELPAASLVATRAVWTMRQPAAHAAAVESVTARAAVLASPLA